jgi:hypothetical protein
MDIGRAFAFVTEDEEWLKKILIGGLIIWIPIIGQLAIYGYTFETARNVAQGHPRPLPDWTDFGDKLMKGLYAMIIQIVYSLPVIILSCVLMLPLMLLPQSEEAAVAGSLVMFCLVPIIIVLGLAIGFITLVAQARYVQTDTLSAAFEFKVVFRMLRESFGDWVMLFLTAILAGLAASVVGSIVCGIGVLFTSVYAYAVIGHALGQIIVKQRGGTGGSDIGNIPPTYGSPA